MAAPSKASRYFVLTITVALAAFIERHRSPGSMAEGLVLETSEDVPSMTCCGLVTFLPESYGYLLDESDELPELLEMDPDVPWPSEAMVVARLPEGWESRDGMEMFRLSDEGVVPATSQLVDTGVPDADGLMRLSTRRPGRVLVRCTSRRGEDVRHFSRYAVPSMGQRLDLGSLSPLGDLDSPRMICEPPSGSGEELSQVEVHVLYRRVPEPGESPPLHDIGHVLVRFGEPFRFTGLPDGRWDIAATALPRGSHGLSVRSVGVVNGGNSVFDRDDADASWKIVFERVR